MNKAYLCLGGNIGNRKKTLDLALLKINELIGQIASKSGIYETEAWGVENQKAYLNQCVKIETDLAPDDLINGLLSIEKSLGRERTINHAYESRTIDLDILFYNDIILNHHHLIIPHPRLHLRKFVLTPMNEIAPNYLHPLLNKTIFSLLEECDDSSEVKHFKSNQ